MADSSKRTRIYVVKIGGAWHIATKSKAENYGEPREGIGLRADDLIWSEVGTTAWLGIVGAEERSEYLEG